MCTKYERLLCTGPTTGHCALQQKSFTNDELHPEHRTLQLHGLRRGELCCVPHIVWSPCQWLLLSSLEDTTDQPKSYASCIEFEVAFCPAPKDLRNAITVTTKSKNGIHASSRGCALTMAGVQPALIIATSTAIPIWLLIHEKRLRSWAIPVRVSK